MKTIYKKLPLFLLAAILVIGGGFMVHNATGQDLYPEEPPLENGYLGKSSPDNVSHEELPSEDVFPDESPINNVSADNPSLEKDTRISLSATEFFALMESFTKDGVCVYPDDYAGAYSNDAGYVIILTTKKNFDEVSFKGLITGSVTFEYAQHSYNSLKSLQAFIGPDYMLDLGVNSTAILDNLNVLRIGLANLHDKDKVMNSLKNNYPEFDESMVYFIQCSLATLVPKVSHQ